MNTNPSNTVLLHTKDSMQANASSNDFLDILEKLPEADRLRILEILPKENAVAALQAALRERSRLRGKYTIDNPNHSLMETIRTGAASGPRAPAADQVER